MPPRFPGQLNGDCKIPTIIYYDRAGKTCAVGAEVMKEGVFKRAREEDWIRVEWCVHCNLSESSDNIQKV